MIFPETKLFIGDNTEASLGKCIRILGTNKRTVGFLGDYIVLVLPHRHLIRRLLTKNIYLAVIVVTKKNSRRRSGYYVKGTLNKVVLFSEQGKLVGNVIHGVVLHETLYYGLSKLASLAKNIL
jgi:ribosomal protein L14